MDYQVDSTYSLPNSEGKMYAWHITVAGIDYNIYQDNNGPITIMVKNEEGDLEPADFGTMKNAAWLKVSNVRLMK